MTNHINDSQQAARRNLTAVSDWLTGIIIEVRDELPSHRMKCRECGELLCVIDPNDSLWVLADVARGHRQFCRDKEERQIHEQLDAKGWPPPFGSIDDELVREGRREPQ